MELHHQHLEILPETAEIILFWVPLHLPVAVVAVAVGLLVLDLLVVLAVAVLE